MRRLTTLALIVTLLLGLLPATARADTDDKLDTTGLVLILGGIGAIAGSFNYSTGCGASETTVYLQSGTYSDTSCVYTSPSYVSVTDPTTDATFARPGLLYAGVGAIVTGIVLMKLPAKAQRVAPSIQVGPQSIGLAKTITVGRRK